MIKNDQQDEKALQELRATITESGWKDSAETIARDIEYVADLCDARLLPLVEVRNFRYNTQVIINTLLELRDGSCDAAIYRLDAAVQAFNHALESRRCSSHTVDGSETYSLSGAMAWRDHVEHARCVFEAACHSWRVAHLGRIGGQRAAALKCIEEIEKRLPLLKSGRLADVPKQHEYIEKCVILTGELAGYAGDMGSVELYTDAIVHDRNRWAAFLEALIDSKWLDSRVPSGYLARVTATKYRLEVRPDQCGRDSQGFSHSAGPGGRIRESDALGSSHTSYLAPEEITDRPDEALLERRFTDLSIAELRRAAAEDPLLIEYVNARIRNPKWKRLYLWKSLGWSEHVGKKIDRKFRRLRQQLKDKGAGMEWRTLPQPGMPEASLFTFFEVLADGTRGRQFGVMQHKSMKTQVK